MSDNTFGFGKFVPGFDFLQGLAKNASEAMPQLPSLSNWVAPTLNVEELDKRISELKAVHFWLEQNSKALGATIQALEVQKMTLATLKGMNMSMGELANALKLKPGEGAMGTAPKAAARAAPAAAEPAAEEAASSTAAGRKKAPQSGAEESAAKAPGQAASGVVDPMQWWGALTQQFQQIAAGAMQDAAQKTAVDSAMNMAGAMAKTGMKAATSMAKAAAPKAAAPKAVARKKRPAAKR